jgi:hypothetical protein
MTILFNKSHRSSLRWRVLNRRDIVVSISFLLTTFKKLLEMYLFCLKTCVIQKTRCLMHIEVNRADGKRLVAVVKLLSLYIQHRVVQYHFCWQKLIRSRSVDKVFVCIRFIKNQRVLILFCDKSDQLTSWSTGFHGAITVPRLFKKFLA